MLTETSLLDPEEGIRFRGLTIKECQERLPKAKGGREPLPEALLWLLLTGEVPSQAQANALSHQLAIAAELPADVSKLLGALPRDMHPMTQLCMGVLALQPRVRGAAARRRGGAGREARADPRPLRRATLPRRTRRARSTRTRRGS
jgi:citrate synthase